MGVRLGSLTVAGMLAVACLAAWTRAATVTLQDGVTPRIGGGTYTGTSDAWLNESGGYQDDNYGASYELRVKYDGSLNGAGFAEDHTVLRFDLPSVSFSSIGAASLELFYVEARDFTSDNALGIKTYRIAPNRWWYENDGGPGGKDNEGVNYLYRDRDQTLAWTGLGAWNDKIDDGNGTNLIKRTGGLVPGAIEPGNWVPFNVQPSVAQWYGGVTNHGFSIFSCWFQGSGNMVWSRFASRDTNNTAVRPKLTISYQGASIGWVGAVNGNWDTNTANWNVGGYQGQFGQGDHVTFADGASNPGVTVASGGVSPGSVTISNSAIAYVFSGGSIGGSGGLTKRGSGQATLSGANSYTGPTLVQAGRVLVGANNALGVTPGGTVISNGAALGLQNVNYTAAEPLTLHGAGVGGSGALYAASGHNTFGGPITLATDTTLGVDSGLSLTLNNAISGGGSLTKTGAGTLTFAGPTPNTYGGNTVINQGLLTLSRTTGPAVPGPLWIGDGVNAAIVRLENHGQLAPTAPVTVRSGSQLNLNHYDAAVGGLALQDGSVSTGNGVLTLGGNVTSSGNLTNIISGNVDLGGALRTFAVADGAATDDLLISAALGNGGVLKAGAGRLVLSGPNGHAGGTVVSEGVLTVTSDAALGALAGNVMVSNNARLEVRGNVAVGNRILRLNGHGDGLGALCSVMGSNSWAGPIQLGMTATVGANPDAALTLNGLVDATGQTLYFGAHGFMVANHVIQGNAATTVIKTGPGTLSFEGAEPNAYLGATLVWQGQLRLNKAQGPAVPGNLTIGDALLLMPASVVCAGPDQFAPACRVTINPGSLLNLNGNEATLGGIILNGGTANSGAGTLHLHGPLRSIGQAEAWVLGNLALGGYQDIRVTGEGDLCVGARVMGGAFTKWGTGSLVLTNINSFTVPCTIAGGGVWVNNDPTKGYGLGSTPITVETAPVLGEFDALLGGTGSVSGPVTVRNSGILSPGPRSLLSPPPVGTLVISNNVNLGPASLLRVEVDATGRNVDVLDLQGGGNLTIAADARLQLVGKLQSPRPLVFVKRAQSITGTFEGWPQNGPVPDQPNWFIHYGTQRIYFSQVPQPIVYFRALATNGAVLVTWRTAVEIETTGFDLFRWEEGEGWVRVNPERLPAQNPDGAVYYVVDAEAQPGVPCRYRLVEHASGGVEHYEFARTPTDFAFSAPPRILPGGVELRWSSRVDESYDLLVTSDLNESLIVFQTNLVATPPENVFVFPSGMPMPPQQFFRLRLAP